MQQKWDVIVVGAGPGGTLAAKKCASYGLKTLLLEKNRMPRDKVCSGMVMGKWAQDIVMDQFGSIPDEVFVEPRNLLGYAVHVPGTTVRTLDLSTPITWRKKLDWWMASKAREAGATVMDQSPVTGVIKDDTNTFKVRFRHAGQIIECKTHFLVGADGARSIVRKELYPGIKVTYWHCYRECYDVRLDLPERRFNFFSSIETAPFYFCTHDKDGFMLMEGGAPIGQISQTARQSRQYLVENHDMKPNLTPLWKDACVEPILYRELFNGSFRPAVGNCLITGDAAGLNMPVTGEGVGTSLMTGLEAARSIIQSSKNGSTADQTYLTLIDMIITKFKDIYQYSRIIKAAADNGDPSALSEALLKSWDHALKVFDEDII